MKQNKLLVYLLTNFIDGICGIILAGSTKPVIIDSKGQLGSVATSPSVTASSYSATISIYLPVEFGSSTRTINKVDKQITLRLAEKTYMLCFCPTLEFAGNGFARVRARTE
jgi:hypothetical protein